MSKNNQKQIKFSVWAIGFWNDFFHPRHPGVFLILGNLLGIIFFTCLYVIFTIYFGSLSQYQSLAYLIFFVSNLFIILISLLVIHFLTMTPQEISLKFCLWLYLGIFVALLLGIAALVLFHIPPSNEDMKDFAHGYFSSYNREPKLLGKLHQESKCCGVNGIEDFYFEDYKTVYAVPESCCKIKKMDCGTFHRDKDDNGMDKMNLTSNSTYFYTKGCFLNGRKFSDLKSMSPEVYQDLQYVLNFTWLNFFFVLVLLIIYSYYIFYRLPKEKDYPPWTNQSYFKRFLLCREIPCCIKCVPCPSRPDECFEERLEEGGTKVLLISSEWHNNIPVTDKENLESPSYTGKYPGAEEEFERSELFVGRSYNQALNGRFQTSGTGSLNSSVASESISEIASNEAASSEGSAKLPTTNNTQPTN